MKEHEYKHTGERPYVCKIDNCGKNFRQRSSYFRHVKYQHLKDADSININEFPPFTNSEVEELFESSNEIQD